LTEVDRPSERGLFRLACPRDDSSGQQTGSKRLKSASLNHAEWVGENPEKLHE
jgi:hypothetical protein